MKFIKKNKIVFIAIAIFLVVVLLIFQIKNIFFLSSNAVYGDRLKGIDDVEVTKSDKSTITDTLKEDESVSEAKVSLSGRIINIIITVNDDTSVDTAKPLADKSIEKLSKDQKSYFDIQVFIKKDSEASDFPIIGYKNNTNDTFTWTKDRAGS